MPPLRPCSTCGKSADEWWSQGCRSGGGACWRKGQRGVDLSGYLQPFGQAAVVMPAVPHHGVWPEIIREAVHLATVNWEAKLSAQDRFSFDSFTQLFLALSRAARDPAHHPAITPCAEALLWASNNDFTWVGTSLAERAARPA